MWSKFKPYAYNMLLVSVMFLLLAIVYEFVPFGSETMLTVDLGQQYIDFFSLYKETLTHEPGMLLYSFEKALGGEMIGLWAYYLLSPFNIILLFFNEGNFDIAVTLLTYLKLVASSLSFMYFARSKYKLNTPMALTFSISYAMMSYVMVYMLNIMWLDGLVLLPLIALGLERSLTQRKSLLYVLSLALMMVSNYYIGYMICLFLSFYALFVIIEQQRSFNWKETAKQYCWFIKDSIIACLIACISLIPTIMSISKNKGEYFEVNLSAEVAHSLQDMLSKLFIGSFNFDEMSSGSPNLYAGMLVLLLVILFFANRSIKKSEKIMAGLIFGIYFLSFRYELLDRLWHGGQFPIWYHFRFSFTTSFFCIVLAIKAYIHRPAQYSIKLLVPILIGFGLFAFHYFYKPDYEFLNDWKILLSVLFFAMLLVVLQFNLMHENARQWFILAIVAVELSINSIFILGELNYVNQAKFRDYTSVLAAAVEPVRQEDSNDFYRIHKTFMRTKNEAFYEHYDGMDHFGSTIEAHIPELYGYLGLPDGNGFAVYTNGTMFTDDFFNIRYLLDVSPDTEAHTAEDEYLLYQEGTDLDMQAHTLVRQEARFWMYENPERFGLGMEVSPELASASFHRHQAIQNQETLLRLLDYDGTGEPYFTKVAFDEVEYDKVEVTDKGDGDYYTYQNQATGEDDAWVHFHYTTTDAPYYFTLPSQLNKDKVYLNLDHKRYRFYTPYRRRQITNASYQTPGEHILSMQVKEDELKANLIYLYRFDEERYQELVAKRANAQFEIEHFQADAIRGRIHTHLPQSYVLFTIPYDKNWQVKVNGQKAESVAALSDTLLAVPVSAGENTIELAYRPKSILIGSGLSVLGVLLLIGQVVYLKRQDAKQDSENLQS